MFFSFTGVIFFNNSIAVSNQNVSIHIYAVLNKNTKIMKKFFSPLGMAIVVVFLTLVSCDDDDNSFENKCNVSDPVEELAWLKAEIDDMSQDEYAYYVMANYKGEAVFYNGNCNPVINYASIVKNCSGEELGNRYDLENDLTDITILWQHEESECDFDE